LLQEEGAMTSRIIEPVSAPKQEPSRPGPAIPEVRLLAPASPMPPQLDPPEEAAPRYRVVLSCSFGRE
jgi:hypothetical protein